MKVKSIAEWNILQYFWPTLSNDFLLKTNFRSFLEWSFYSGFTVYTFEAAMICPFLAVPRIGLQCHLVVAFSGLARLRFYGIKLSPVLMI